jgi:hypothetical protein
VLGQADEDFPVPGELLILAGIPSILVPVDFLDRTGTRVAFWLGSTFHYHAVFSTPRMVEERPTDWMSVGHQLYLSIQCVHESCDIIATEIMPDCGLVAQFQL